jgi:hypothetical protein
MTDNPNTDGFSYLAHSRGNTPKDKFYLGVYRGSQSSGKLHSLSGKYGLGDETIGSFRTFAHANGAPDGNGGSGYDIFGWYQLIYCQCLYILKYANLDSQSAVGKGAVASALSRSYTGSTNDKGMNWGETAGTKPTKLFGIEDLWGNQRQFIDGLCCDNDYHIKTATEGFNDTGENYIDNDVLTYGVDAGYMRQFEITAFNGRINFGFLPVNTEGSETTYFCDYASLISNSIPVFGGQIGSESKAGIFNLEVSATKDTHNPSTNARLMYL